MRARSWLAVSAGTVAGRALAITGIAQSTVRPAATTAHLRRTSALTKILALMLWAAYVGQVGH
jgi:F0F1-type ATP synthase membrane subunit c/vacuolar-type H+-ATPase subunit K